ncbi:MAG: right-handed parallel beta-helix repeat-containing protein [Methanobacteriota archaeon]|nr:MAG: right-handed parallel beta-helix repeat-containing protein [Euryarchaeota archaeon]
MITNLSEAFVSRSPILITSNSMFDGDHGVTDGSGTSGDPWIISNWNISGDATNAIEIRNTTDHFVIRNVNLYASTLWNDKKGVYLYNVTNGAVDSSFISGEFEYGIHVEDCTDVVTSSNHITDIDSISGISVDYSSYVTVSSNNISSCTYEIRIIDSNNCSVHDNNLTDSLGGYGIATFDVDNTTVFNNTLSSIYYGLYLIGPGTTNLTVSGNNINSTAGGLFATASYVNITDNHLEYTGMGFQQTVGVQVLNNTFADMAATCAVMLHTSTNATLRGNNMTSTGIDFVANSREHYSSHTITTDNLVNDRPVRYFRDCTSLSLDGESTGQLILANCTDAEVRNLELTSGYVGMSVGYSENVEIDSCNLSGNSRHNILFMRTDNVSVSRCRIHDAGVYGVLSYGFVTNLTLANNTISDSGYDGVRVDYTTQVNITGNSISRNGFNCYGIEIYQCNWGNISENNIFDNYVGLRLSIGTTNFRVFHNNFINNTYQAYDVLSNTWDDGYPSGGNYWDDYTDWDNDTDGIWDNPYVIDEDSQDDYPLVQPIPEFSQVVVPVLTLLTLMMICRLRKKRTQ